MGTSALTATPTLRRVGTGVADAELVAHTRAGDDRAFEQLYERYHRRIAAYVQGMVHDHARAEDITQDVFMSALRRLRATETTIAFKPWVYEIAKNACIDQFRRSRRAEEVSYDADDGGVGTADLGRLSERRVTTPDVAVDQKQQLDHLRGAFGGLSETHHQILVLRELEGLSYREIGERLGMTRPAVESTLFRARRRLTEEYEELVTGERCIRIQSIIAAAATGGAGTRDRRRMARHVSHCQPCLRAARVAGVPATDLVHEPVRAKIAGFIPVPEFVRRLLNSPAAEMGAVVDPAIVGGWGKAVATAATVVVAGLGAGVATEGPVDGLRDPLRAGSLVQPFRGGDDGASARPVPAPAAPAAATGERSGGERRDAGAGARTGRDSFGRDATRSVRGAAGSGAAGDATRRGVSAPAGGGSSGGGASGGGSGSGSGSGGGATGGGSASGVGGVPATPDPAGARAPAPPAPPSAPGVAAPQLPAPQLPGAGTGTSSGSGAAPDPVRDAGGVVAGAGAAVQGAVESVTGTSGGLSGGQ